MARVGLGLFGVIFEAGITSVRLSHSCAIGLRLTRINITTVRLTHSSATGVKLIHT